MTPLQRLAATVESRKTADPDSSWTAKLLAKGPEKRHIEAARKPSEKSKNCRRSGQRKRDRVTKQDAAYQGNDEEYIER